MGRAVTAAEQDTPARRDGTPEDIAGLRLYYRLDADPAELSVVWRPDRGPTIAEAMAVKTATVTDVTVRRMLAVLERSSVAEDDPEALQAVVWLLRRFRQGETGLSITALSGLDLLSLRTEYVDAQGVELDFPDPTPDPAQRALAADIAGDLMRHLPGLQLADALVAAASLIRAAPDPEPAAGEDAAGAEPAAAAPAKRAPRKRAAAPATTPTMLTPTSGGGSRS